MKKTVKKVFLLAVAFIICFTFVLVIDAEETYAASKNPGKVTITSAKSVDYDSVKITWKKANNAKKYQVYRATSKNGTYKRVITTTKTTFTNNKLTTGKTYYYKVRAVNGTKKGNFSSKWKVTPTLGKASITSIKATAYNSAKITWNKVDGAKKYQVYRATSKNGTYKRVITTTKTTFANSNLTTGKTYYYKVRAVRYVNDKAKHGAYSTIKRVTPKLTTPVLSTIKAEGEKTITITWNKVAGAEKYQIYRATSQSGSYENIKTVTACSYTDTSLTGGKTYYYKIRAVRGNYQSNYSNIKNMIANNKVTYELAEGEVRTIENLVFEEDVTVSGDFGTIIFDDCEFNGDIINTADQFTRVIISDNTTVKGNCVFKNTIKEATMDSPIPKFICGKSLNLVCEDCIGSCVLLNIEDSITFNGETYSITDAEQIYDAETNSFSHYEGQGATSLFVGQWWESGELKSVIFCE